MFNFKCAVSTIVAGMVSMMSSVLAFVWAAGNIHREIMVETMWFPSPKTLFGLVLILSLLKMTLKSKLVTDEHDVFAIITRKVKEKGFTSLFTSTTAEIAGIWLVSALAVITFKFISYGWV